MACEVANCFLCNDDDGSICRTCRGGFVKTEDGLCQEEGAEVVDEPAGATEPFTETLETEEQGTIKIFSHFLIMTPVFMSCNKCA